MTRNRGQKPPAAREAEITAEFSLPQHCPNWNAILLTSTESGPISSVYGLTKLE
jgi:hypothetical protein